MVDESRIIFDQDIRHQFNIKILSGSDEAGRGAMAGPVVVASVILPPNYQNPKINDSKLLTQKQREQLFHEIKQVALAFAISIIEASKVDQLNPKQASIFGMKESIQELKIQPELCLIDAEKVELTNFCTMALIKGDAKSQSIAAASILAKVTRDNIMKEYAQVYPGYDFDKHKGYCTQSHQIKLSEFGITPIHRLSYKPVQNILKNSDIK